MKLKIISARPFSLLKTEPEDEAENYFSKTIQSLTSLKMKLKIISARPFTLLKTEPEDEAENYFSKPSVS